MAWRIDYRPAARRQLKGLDRVWQRRITDYMDLEVASLDDPRFRGRALTGDLRGLWRYRVGDFRVVCEIQEDRLVVDVVEIGHRREVYR